MEVEFSPQTASLFLRIANKGHAICNHPTALNRYFSIITGLTAPAPRLRVYIAVEDSENPFALRNQSHLEVSNFGARPPHFADTAHLEAP